MAGLLPHGFAFASPHPCQVALAELLVTRVLLHGVHTTPRGMINLSTALSPGDLDDIAAAYEAAFTLVRGHVS